MNIGLRLVKENFKLQFGNLQKFDYSVEALNTKYTRFKLMIEYYESVAKDKLAISVKSPITNRRLLLTRVLMP